MAAAIMMDRPGRERQTDRQTERERMLARERERERERAQTVARQNRENSQANSWKRPERVNLLPLARVKSWATNTRMAMMEKTQASTELACTAWRYSAGGARERERETCVTLHYMMGTRPTNTHDSFK